MTDEQKKILHQACREAIAEVYTTTLQLNAVFEEAHEKHLAAQDQSVVATIGFAGSIEASLVMIVSDRVACGLVSSMLSTEIESVVPEVLDGVGEILNMVAGAAKRKGDLAAFHFDYCIPSVIFVEKQMHVAMLKDTDSATIVAGSEKGPALFLLTSPVNDGSRRSVRVPRKDKEVAQSLEGLMKDKKV